MLVLKDQVAHCRCVTSKLVHFVSHLWLREGDEMDIFLMLITLRDSQCTLCRCTHTHPLSLSSVCFILERMYQKGPGKGLAKVQLPSHRHTHTLTHTQRAHLVPILGDYIAFQTHLHTQAVKLKTNLSQHTRKQGYAHTLSHSHLRKHRINRAKIRGGGTM